MNRWWETCQRWSTPRPDYVYTKRQRIAELAKNCTDMVFLNLAHHIDIEWMLTAHWPIHARTGPSAWTDNTAEEYEVNLEAIPPEPPRPRPNPARTWRRLCVECTSPRQARPPRPVLWGYHHHMRINILQRAVLQWCLSRCTRRTFWKSPTAFAPAGVLTEHWTHYWQTGDEAGRRPWIVDVDASEILRHDRPWPAYRKFPQASGTRTGVILPTDRQTVLA